MYYFQDIESSPSAVEFFNYPLARDQQTQTVRYECTKCDSLFSSRIYLHQHEATVHNRIFHCPFCAALFSNKADYRTHVIAHSEKRYLPCAFCRNKVFYDIDEYNAHVKAHREPYMYTCEKCPAMFPQLSLLRNHKGIHLTRKFVHTIHKISHKVRETHDVRDRNADADENRVVSPIIDDSADVMDCTPAISGAEVSTSSTVVAVEEEIPASSSLVSTSNADNMVRKSGRPRRDKSHVSEAAEVLPSSSVVAAEDEIPASSSLVSTSNADNMVRKRGRPRKNKSQEKLIPPSIPASTVSSNEKTPLPSKRIKKSKKIELKQAVSLKNQVERKEAKASGRKCYLASTRSSKVAEKKFRSVKSIVKVSATRNAASSVNNEEIVGTGKDVEGVNAKASGSKKSTSSTNENDVGGNEVGKAKSKAFGAKSLISSSNNNKVAAKKVGKTKAKASSATRRKSSNSSSDNFEVTERQVEVIDDIASVQESCTSSTNIGNVVEKSSGSSLKSILKKNLRPRKTAEGKAKADPNYSFRQRAAVNYCPEENSSDSTDIPSSNQKDSYVGFFMCLSCKRVFQTYSALNMHKNLHIENKGVRCSECRGLFAGPGNLAYHKKSSSCGFT